MTNEPTASERDQLHPLALKLASGMERDYGSQVQVVRDDSQRWFAIEETSSTAAFAEAKGHELRVVPFLGDASLVRSRPYLVGLDEAWTEGVPELVADLRRVTTDEETAELRGHLDAAFRFWSERDEEASNAPRAGAVSNAAPAASAGGLEVELRHAGAISFSHANSRFPVISALALRDREFSGSSNVRLKVSLTCLGRQMAEPWEMVVPKVGAEPVVFQGNQVQLVLNPLAFAEIDERLAGEFTVDVETDGGA
ncbi:MAG: hypothetical protein ABIR57_03450, partial [Aeromicrobium sp.]